MKVKELIAELVILSGELEVILQKDGNSFLLYSFRRKSLCLLLGVVR